MENGRLLFGAWIVIPAKLRNQVLQVMQLGHLGMQHVKQLAVYWPHINYDIEHLC